MPKIIIDNHAYEAEEGTSLLDAAKSNGIDIPTLCYHPALRPSGSCKLCAVEVVAKSGRPVAMLSCIMKVREGLEVKTNGKIVTTARKRAFKNLLQMAPQSKYIRDLADKFRIDLGPPPDGCVRCRLCIRVCKEIVGPGALKMKSLNGQKFVVPVEDRCIGCGTCANLCRTNAIRVEDRDNVRTIMIRDDVIGRHPLVRCEGCGKMFATPKYIEFIDKKRCTDHPDVKVHHHYCPTCAKLFSDRVQTLGLQPQKLRMPGHR